MKNQTKLQIIGVILIALMLSTKARCQLVIDSVYVNGVNTTNLIQGQTSTLTVYTHPASNTWATVNVNDVIDLHFLGIKPLQTSKAILTAGNWAATFTVYAWQWQSLNTSLSSIYFDYPFPNSQGTISNYYQMNIVLAAGVENFFLTDDILVVKYYNFDGLEVQPVGLVIKQTTYKSGKTKTQKLFITQQ